MIKFTSVLKFLIVVIGFILTPTLHAIDYTYDDLNRLIQVTYPTGQTIHYSYDAVGNLLSVILIDNQSHNTETSHQVADASSATAENMTAQ